MVLIVLQSVEMRDVKTWFTALRIVLEAHEVVIKKININRAVALLWVFDGLPLKFYFHVLDRVAAEMVVICSWSSSVKVERRHPSCQPTMSKTVLKGSLLWHSPTFSPPNKLAKWCWTLPVILYLRTTIHMHTNRSCNKASGSCESPSQQSI